MSEHFPHVRWRTASSQRCPPEVVHFEKSSETSLFRSYLPTLCITSQLELIASNHRGTVTSVTLLMNVSHGRTRGELPPLEAAFSSSCYTLSQDWDKHGRATPFKGSSATECSSDDRAWTCGNLHATQECPDSCRRWKKKKRKEREEKIRSRTRENWPINVE